MSADVGLDDAGWARYGEAWLRRRLGVLARREGADDAHALARRMAADPALSARVQRGVAWRAPPMFGAPGTVRALRRLVLPLLRTYPTVRIWHPACGSGEEVYGLAIVLHEEGLLARCELYATDACDEALALAREGRVARAGLARHEAAYAAAGGRASLGEYHDGDVGEFVTMRPLLAARVHAFPHDLAGGDASFHEFQLVVCRDVLLRLGASARAAAWGVIDASLARRGVLALGAAEGLRDHPDAARYERLGAGTPGGRHYRRLA